jgi:hypothetical protein
METNITNLLSRSKQSVGQFINEGEEDLVMRASLHKHVDMCHSWSTNFCTTSSCCRRRADFICYVNKIPRPPTPTNHQPNESTPVAPSLKLTMRIIAMPCSFLTYHARWSSSRRCWRGGSDVPRFLNFVMCKFKRRYCISRFKYKFVSRSNARAFFLVV